MTTAQSTSALSGRTLNGRSLLAIIVGGSIISSIGLGARSTFGVFLDPVTESLDTGRGTYSFAIAIQNLMWGLSQPIAGALADRFGSARVLAAGGVGYAVALFIMATVETTGAFTLTAGFGVGIATGAASFSVVLAAVGRMAPPEKAPMALGIVTAMGSVGQLILVPLVRLLIDQYQWRTTITIIGFVVLAIAVTAPLVRGTARQQQGPVVAASDADAVPLRHELRRAAHSRAYLLLNAAFFVCGFHVTFIGTHLVSYAGDVGVTARAATFGLAIIGGFNIVGSLLAGRLAATHSKTKLLAIIYAGRAIVIAVFVLLPANSATVIGFGAMIGLLWLSTVPLTGGIVNGLFGTTHSGTLFGIVFLAHQLGSFTGVWMGGELADRTGSYNVVWWIAVGLGVLAMLLHLMIDESPAAQPPPKGEGVGRIVPAAGAAAMLVAGGTAALTAEAASGSEVGDEIPPICILHVDG